VEAVLGVQDAGTPGGSTRDLDRRLDGLRARVRRHHRRDAAGRAREQLLGEDPTQQRHAELREVGRPGGHHILDGRDHVRVVPAQTEHPVAGDQVQVAPAF
jgi:hypothetical protein